MNFLVDLDDTKIALMVWDKLFYADRPTGSFDNGRYSKDKSCTLRLIRTTCKSAQIHGCEKSDRISDFYTYLTEEVDLPIVSFILSEEIGVICFLKVELFIIFSIICNIFLIL